MGINHKYPEFKALSNRAYNCIANYNWGHKEHEIHSFEQLAKLTRAELLEISNMGPKTVAEIEAALQARGLSLAE